MSDDIESTGRRTGSRPSPGDERMREAGARLERAVQDLVASARDHLSDSTAVWIEDAARRLREAASEFGTSGARSTAESPDPDDLRSGCSRRRESRRSAVRDARRRARALRREARALRRARHSAGVAIDIDADDAERDASGRSRRLRRGADRMIAGVCSGLAEHWDVDAWVVRCGAVTSLIFMPQIAFIAYWVLFFNMRPARPIVRGANEVDAGAGLPDDGVDAPELGPHLSPRHSLGEVRSRFDRLELKLRRMESYVTSSQYPLDRELAAIDAADRNAG